MLSSIEPGQEVAPHTDAYDGYRWHFPLTAPVYWWDAESGDAVLGLWHWSPVNARIMHTVRNPTETRRVTLIVDFVT
jgi:aspartyl/asparaginyl beta-hydroxylase (cupin superfamily)